MITGHLANGDYAALRDSWQRTLVAENKAPRTISTYLSAADELGSFLAEPRPCRPLWPTSGASTSRPGSANS
jgi:hypothetical protein